MGLTFTKLFSRLFSKKEMRILMVSKTFRAPGCSNVEARFHLHLLIAGFWSGS